MWCQHDEKYGCLFLNEPHRSRKTCLFEHKPKQDDCNTTQEIIPSNGGAVNESDYGGNYARFPYDQSTVQKSTNKVYQSQMSSEELRLVTNTQQIQDNEGLLIKRNTGSPSSKV